jgi:hypothetical protein
VSAQSRCTRGWGGLTGSKAGAARSTGARGNAVRLRQPEIHANFVYLRHCSLEAYGIGGTSAARPRPSRSSSSASRASPSLLISRCRRRGGGCDLLRPRRRRDRRVRHGEGRAMQSRRGGGEAARRAVLRLHPRTVAVWESVECDDGNPSVVASWSAAEACGLRTAVRPALLTRGRTEATDTWR